MGVVVGEGFFVGSGVGVGGFCLGGVGRRGRWVFFS